ncbi:MFS transporter, partial [Stagnihabitans tardus]|nr:MFS transporter [Stagnihabitans tardus]
MGAGHVTGLLAASLFLAGLSAAAITPYRAVVAVETLGLSNTAWAVMLGFNAVATALASVVLGHLSDRIRDRRLLVILAAMMGVLAYGAIFALPGRLTYILSFCLVLPFGGTLFSQSFAFSRAWYDRNAPERAMMMTSVLRTVFSAAWVLVPPVAAWIASRFGVFQVFAFAALGHLGCTLAFGLLLTRPDALLPPAPRVAGGSFRRIGRQTWVRIAGILGLRTALLLNMTLLPLFLLNDAGGSYADIGHTASAAALLEIPFMLAWGWLAGRWGKERVLVLNGALYAAYLVAMVFARTPAQVLWLQIPNAVATAALV